ncbi:MAG: hypothetical protein HZC28_09675 [Spirochaetes bacterium]|nr:hypothetical protein [Spirochaetota bacterium]
MNTNSVSTYSSISAKTAMIVSVIAIALASAMVLLISHKSLFIKLQIILAVLSGCLFIFLVLGLYIGILIKKDPIHYQPVTIKIESIPDALSSFMEPVVELGEGISGMVISIVVWIIVSIVFVLLFLIAANIAVGLIFVTASIMYWIFYRAYRIIFIKHRRCKGNLKKSIGYSMLYTLLYTGWLYAIILIWNIVRTLLAKST